MKTAGIDVHKKVLMVVVVDATMPEEKPARRRFVTDEIERVPDVLIGVTRGCQPMRVIMGNQLFWFAKRLPSRTTLGQSSIENGTALLGMICRAMRTFTQDGLLQTSRAFRTATEPMGDRPDGGLIAGSRSWHTA